jgi:sentrin-specific protease 7
MDLDSFEDEKMIALQWEISNIISISCKWAQNVSNSLYFIITIPLVSYFSQFNMYDAGNQVGSALITLLAGPKAETGNAGTRCAFPHITMLHDT